MEPETMCTCWSGTVWYQQGGGYAWTTGSGKKRSGSHHYDLVDEASIFSSLPFCVVIPYTCRSIFYRWPDTKYHCDNLVNILLAVEGSSGWLCAQYISKMLLISKYKLLAQEVGGQSLWIQYLTKGMTRNFWNAFWVITYRHYPKIGINLVYANWYFWPPGLLLREP